MTIRLKPLAVSVAVPLAGGLLSNWLSGDVRAVYESLDLPAFAPPAWIFGVVWPLLYLLLGIAAYLLWEQPASSARTQALTFYGAQLLLNFLWSPLFFRFGLFRFAFWELCALFALAAVTAACFAMLSRRTLWLTAPYLCWLLYAAALNRAVAALN